MNDLIIKSNTIEEGIHRLKMVLDTAAIHGLRIKWSKCLSTRVDRIFRISYLLQHNAAVKDEDCCGNEVSSFKEYERNSKFFRTNRYFCKFIGKYATITHPLSDFLKKDTSFVFDLMSKRMHLEH